jgi:hypothetical protein
VPGSGLGATVRTLAVTVCEVRAMGGCRAEPWPVLAQIFKGPLWLLLGGPGGLDFQRCLRGDCGLCVPFPSICS